jgi:hypothetical protein
MLQADELATVEVTQAHRSGKLRCCRIFITLLSQAVHGLPGSGPFTERLMADEAGQCRRSRRSRHPNRRDWHGPVFIWPWQCPGLQSIPMQCRVPSAQWIAEGKAVRTNDGRSEDTAPAPQQCADAHAHYGWCRAMRVRQSRFDVFVLRSQPFSASGGKLNALPTIFRLRIF